MGKTLLKTREIEEPRDDCMVEAYDDYKGSSVVVVDYEYDAVELSRSSAIAAARAILKHFNVGVE